MSKEVSIGKPEIYPTLPAEVTVENHPYFLVQDDGGYKLVSAFCPHAGGVIIKSGKGFLCPLHFWSFEQSGKCVNVPRVELASYPVTEREGELVAVL